MDIFRIIIALGVFNFFSVNSNKTTENTPTSQSMHLASRGTIKVNVIKRSAPEINTELDIDVETEPVLSLDTNDVTANPAIWNNTDDPENSLVLSANSYSGIYVHNLNGEALQYLEVGKINSIDLRDDFEYNDSNMALVVASNKSNNCISVFYIDKETRYLSDVMRNIETGLDEILGVCLYRSIIDNNFYVFASGKDGSVEQWMFLNEETLEVEKVRSFTLPGMPIDMEVSDLSSTLYVSVKNNGIYKVSADPYVGLALNKMIDNNVKNINFSDEIQRLASFTYKHSEYLLTSARDKYSYAIFNADRGEYITSFKLLEEVKEADIKGVDIVNASLNNKFASGLLVAQNRYKRSNGTLKNQSVKYVSFEKIQELLDKELEITSNKRTP